MDDMFILFLIAFSLIIWVTFIFGSISIERYLNFRKTKIFVPFKRKIVRWQITVFGVLSSCAAFFLGVASGSITTQFEFAVPLTIVFLGSIGVAYLSLMTATLWAVNKSNRTPYFHENFQ